MVIQKRGVQLSQANVAFQIASLIEAIESCETPAFRVKRNRFGYERFEETKLSRRLSRATQMFDLFDCQIAYDYSEHLQVFWDACHDIGLERSPDGPVCLDEGGTAYLSHEESMNVLVVRIRQLTRQQRYRRSQAVRRELAKRQAREITEYTNAVMDRYSRTTVVRVNFYYRTECHARLRVEHVFDDLDAMVAKHSRRSVFDHLIGYAYAVEQGDRRGGRGYHIHAAYFFNGNKICCDIYKASEICRMWEEVTCSQGMAHSSNQERTPLGITRGVGCIQKNDKLTREKTCELMRYLVKLAQPLHLKPQRARCLRRGTLRSF